MSGTRDEQIGQRVRKRRKALGLTIKQVAAKMGEGTHFTTIGKLETGKIQFTTEWLSRFSDALDIPVVELVNERFSPENLWRSPVYPNMAIEREGHPFSGYSPLAFIPVIADNDDVFSVLEPDHAAPDRFAFGHWYITIDPTKKAMKDGSLLAVRMPDFDGLRFITFKHSPPSLCYWPNGNEYEALGLKPFEIIGTVVYQSRAISAAVGDHLSSFLDLRQTFNSRNR